VRVRICKSNHGPGETSPRIRYRLPMPHQPELRSRCTLLLSRQFLGSSAIDLLFRVMQGEDKTSVPWHRGKAKAGP
jgi:hypothetical protein